MRRLMCSSLAFALLLAIPSTAAAVERLRAVDVGEAARGVDIREVRVTADAPAFTVVIRFADPLEAFGPPAEVELGAVPAASGDACVPRASGPSLVRFRAASMRQRAFASSGSRTTRPIVWPGIDDRELVVHVSGRAAGSGAIGCIAARTGGAGADTLGPSVPRVGTWPVLTIPSHDRRTGRVAVAVQSAEDVQVRFEMGLYRTFRTVLTPTGPSRRFAAPFDGTVVDARDRLPGRPLAWRATATNEGGTGYSTPSIARFDDIVAPTVRLRGATVTGGTTVALRGELRDDSGRAALVLEWREGARVLGRVRRSIGRVPATGTLIRFRTPPRAGRLVACGVGVDAAGNRSPRACVTVVLRAPRS